MELLIPLVVATLRISVPYVLAALGGFASERSGVVNIALEGMLLNGAFTCVWVASALESQGVPGAAAAWIGVLGALAAGAATGALHALVCVRWRADQIMSGLAINLLAAGGTKFMLTLLFGSASNSTRISGLPVWEIPGLANWSLTRTLLCTPLVLVTLVLVVAAHRIATRTVWGLRLHAVGEHPDAAAAAGVRPARVRCAAVTVGGAVAALGGAWLALDQHQFTAGISGGRGFIALAALIFGKWTPRGAALACLLFGGAEALQIQLQTAGAARVPTQLLQALPYLVTMVALAGVIGRARPPAALGRPLAE
jgi:general nucleoside transport system permease protein